MINKHKSNKIKENSNTVRHLNNGTDHRHSKSCCDQSSPARRTIRVYRDGYICDVWDYYRLYSSLRWCVNVVKLTPKGLICYLVGLVVETALGQIHSSDIQQGFWLTHCQLFGIWETLYKYCTCISLVTQRLAQHHRDSPGVGWLYGVIRLL